MSQQESTYFEKQTEAKITYEKHQIHIIFQRAKIKLRDKLEISMLQRLNTEFNKQFDLTEDQLTIKITPPDTYFSLNDSKSANEKEKWLMAYNLLLKIKNHSFQRLKLIVCPENVMYDLGLTPHFLHYGVSESIPPYEDDHERLWREARAITASVVDDKYDFYTYLQHHETITLSDKAKSIMTASSYDELLEMIEVQLKELDNFNHTTIKLPKKKWKRHRIVLLIIAFLLVPSLAYNGFATFFKIPESEAYVESSNYFLQDQYSSVFSTLKGYDEEKMPYVVQYQLAKSYIKNEALTEEQRANVENSVTLQSDRNYFLYWILIGRGVNEKATDIARILENRDLIIYGLLKYREEIKGDQSLNGSEREERIKEVQSEIDEYKQEMEQEEKEKQELEEQEEKQPEQNVQENTSNGSKTEN
ncbi:type VII secretion protein EssB [Virgibacillus sp. W0181]|uniref:type VII secretion protein EssB n=1 Tax=Virgibacillus sp. W0181 TaxID=3391581 RepID=UPI003F485C68